MKEIKLKPREYDIIADMASGRFRDDPARFDGGNFLCKCYVQAIIDYCHKNNLVIMDGKLLKKEPKDGQPEALSRG